MSVLAHHPFIKMNGLGNEIVVVDMRAQTATIAASEARAAAQSTGAPYDQLMALHAPRTPGTDAYVRIYNNDGSESGACGNGMRCVAELLFKETGKSALILETGAGLLTCWKGDRPLISTVDTDSSSKPPPCIRPCKRWPPRGNPPHSIATGWRGCHGRRSSAFCCATGLVAV